MTLFEPITANITIAIEALEQLHIDWHAILKAIYEAGIKFACESKQKQNSSLLKLIVNLKSQHKNHGQFEEKKMDLFLNSVRIIVDI
ncbi:MAG: hypothetical protein EZS28_025980 [Streblomastix strix]|uniref:Uncharacterized protein n=1 Tax=Streblomastix strix TaxID=222440 RepID=A0A5J4V7Q9_9EUKA|nr:MAG: hypothetical protein EZS28_025980 [Streblomastix strix]